MFSKLKKEVEKRNGKANKIKNDNAVAWLRFYIALKQLEKSLDKLPDEKK